MFNQLYNNTIRMIEKWNPAGFPRETQYRDDLIKFLRKNLKKGNSLVGSGEKVRINKESGGSRCDISIEREIGIELKNNFKTTTKVHELVGQIQKHRMDWKHMIVVLVGETKQRMLDDLNMRLENMKRKEMDLEGREVKIITVGEII